MRYSMVTALTICTLLLSLQQQSWAAVLHGRPQGEIHTVAFCDLIHNPERYDQTVVRVRVIFRRAGEDFIAIECPDCLDEVWVVPHFDPSFYSRTKRSVQRQFGKYTGTTIITTLVGKFDNSRASDPGSCCFGFLVMYAENAEIIGRGSRGYKLSPKAKKRIKC